MKYFTKPLKFEKTGDDVYSSTNGIKEYRIGKCSDVDNTYFAQSTDEEFFEYCKSWDDAEYLCEKNQEELVRSVLKDHLLEILNNTPD